MQLHPPQRFHCPVRALSCLLPNLDWTGSTLLTNNFPFDSGKETPECLVFHQQQLYIRNIHVHYCIFFAGFHLPAGGLPLLLNYITRCEGIKYCKAVYICARQHELHVKLSQLALSWSLLPFLICLTVSRERVCGLWLLCWPLLLSCFQVTNISSHLSIIFGGVF